MSNRPCPGCSTPPGSPHRPGCDVERCPYCGGQLFACRALGRFGRRGDFLPDADRLPWTGKWPGTEDCVRLGWVWREGKARHGPNPDTDDGEWPDLNRLAGEGRWDRGARRWEARA